MNIRIYIDTDRKQVIDLLRLNMPKYFAPDEEADFVEYLDKHIEHYFVMEQDGAIVGCGGVNLSRDGKMATLSWQFFHPQYQGKGLGTLLTKFRIQHIEEMKGVEAITVRTSQLVYPFYTRFGFQLKETIKDYWAKGLDLYHMEGDVQALGK